MCYMWSSKLPPLSIQLAPLFISQWDALFPDDIAAGGKVAHARRVHGNHKRERENYYGSLDYAKELQVTLKVRLSLSPLYKTTSVPRIPSSLFAI